MSSLTRTVEAMRNEAERQGGASMLTHTPEGGALIYIGSDESDVTGMLVSAIAEIETRRGES